MKNYQINWTSVSWNTSLGQELRLIQLPHLKGRSLLNGKPVEETAPLHMSSSPGSEKEMSRSMFDPKPIYLDDLCRDST
jgi:hypothetical protein